MLERGIAARWPWLIEALGPGSDDASDYPVYVREGRRPGPLERAARDRGLEKLALTGL